MDEKDKVRILNLKPITNKMKDDLAKVQEDSGRDMNKFIYCKEYKGGQIMYYSSEYLNNHDIDTLKAKEKKNKRIFQPSLIGRIKNKLFVWKLKQIVKVKSS